MGNLWATGSEILCEKYANMTDTYHVYFLEYPGAIQIILVKNSPYFCIGGKKLCLVLSEERKKSNPIQIYHQSVQSSVGCFLLHQSVHGMQRWT